MPLPVCRYDPTDAAHSTNDASSTRSSIYGLSTIVREGACFRNRTEVQQ